jgi:hypothetical protein
MRMKSEENKKAIKDNADVKKRLKDVEKRRR